MAHDKKIGQYVARAAMWQMLEDHQGNDVIDDGAWEDIGKATRLGHTVRQAAMDWIRQLERTLMDLGIEPTDEDLVRLVTRAKEEIEEVIRGSRPNSERIRQ